MRTRLRVSVSRNLKESLHINSFLSHVMSESLNSVLDVVSDEVGDLGHHVRHRRGQDDAGAEARQDRQPQLRPRRVGVPR